MVDIIDPKWTELDASNTGAAPDGVQGGYAPSTIAPILRGTRGALKRFYVQNNAIYTSTGSASAYVLTYSGAPTGYSKGIQYAFWANHTNTGAATLNINSLGAKAVVRNDGAALTAGQITSGTVVIVVYDGTSFRLQNLTTNPTFTGQMDVGSLVSTGAISGTNITASGDVTVAGTLKLNAGNGINFANDDTITYNDSTNTWSFVADSGSTPSGTIETQRLRLLSTGDAGETSTGHALQIGPDSAQNIRMDTNEFVIANNGVLAPDSYYFNTGGNITFNAPGGLTTPNLINANGNLRLSNGAPEIKFIDTTSGQYSARLRVDANNVYFDSSTDDVTFGEVFRFELDTKNGYVNGGKIVTLSNDGAGSGVDADLLDGQQGSYYLSASNLNAGTLPNARVSGAYDGITNLTQTGLHTINKASEALRIAGPAASDDPYITFYAGGTRNAYIQHTDGTGTGAGFRFYNDVTDDYLYLSNTNNVDALKFYDSSTSQHNSVWHTGNLVAADITNLYGYTPANAARTIDAGNGLTGGGSLGGDRTITLGTPGTINNSTTNSVSTTSHTHALGFIAAEVSTTSSASTTSFPLGHMIIIVAVPDRTRNALVTPALRTSADGDYIVSSSSDAGSTVTGTWRLRGRVVDQNCMAQRVA